MLKAVIAALVGVVIGALIVGLSFLGTAPAAAGQLASPSANDIAVATAPVEPAPVYGVGSVSYGDPATVAAGLLNDTRGQALISVVRGSLTPAHQGATDLQIVTLGVTVCQAFDRGVEFPALVALGPQNGFSTTEAARMIGASVGALCTEHRAALHM